MSNQKELNSENWVDLYADQLFAFSFTRTRNKALSEDLVQETFFSALKAKANFKGNSSEKTWLYSILKNKIIDHYRKASTKRELNTLDDEERNTDAILLNDNKKKAHGSFFTNKNEASQLIENKEFYSILEKCLNFLPAKTQLAFRYKHIEDLNTDEICKELDITASNYWVLLHRARLSLRECLTKNKMK